MRAWRRGDDRPADPSQRAPAPAADPRWELVAEALELMPIGIVIEDRDGATIVDNARARTPLGDLTGDTLADVALRRALARARTGDAAVETVDIAGTPPRRLEVTATPLSAGGAVASVFDTSERLRLEAVRRDFVANVNHELRTPIGALTVLAEALVAEHDRTTVERLAGRIQAEAGRARALIDDLLDFARVETEAQPPHFPVNLAEVLDMAVGRMSAAAEQRHVGIVLDAEPSTVVQGDHDQLVVAVANLLDNAIKYSDEGSSVRLEARVSSDGDQVEVVVRDEGIGIPPRDLDRVFERFYRVDHARDRRTGGTGLGLAIVRHVAQNHGGDVVVESIEGAGSTFTLRLPIEGR